MEFHVLSFKGNINTILQDIKDDSFNIHLPEKYFHLPENKIRALLNGYFIGNGHTDENSKWGRIRPNLKYRYSTSSEQWANDLCRLSFQIGEPLYCWKQLNHQGLGKKPIYRLSYCTSSEFVLNHGWRNIGEVSISQVEKLDKKVQMYDFEVADNHNFVFTNGIISHNCESLSSLAVSAFEYYRVMKTNS